MKSKVDLISELFREIEADIGTRDLSFLVLRALVNSIENLNKDDFKYFCGQFEELSNIVCSTEPKFGILNYHFKKLMMEFKANLCPAGPDFKEWKRMAIEKINEILIIAKAQKMLLIQNSEKLSVNDKTILIHDHSHTVQDVLIHYKRMNRRFRVIIAEQDYEKTHSNIERMHGADIPFQVVPAYMMSHIYEEVDMAFFGAVTLKNTMDFVMAPGTHSLISELHIEKIPSYMFIDSNKFSLWKSQKRHGVFIHKHKRTHLTKSIEYERIKYSHDRVPAELFELIITNKGIFKPDELKEFFEERLKKYSEEGV